MVRRELEVSRKDFEVLSGENTRLVPTVTQTSDDLARAKFEVEEVAELEFLQKLTITS